MSWEYDHGYVFYFVLKQSMMINTFQHPSKPISHAYGVISISHAPRWHPMWCKSSYSAYGDPLPREMCVVSQECNKGLLSEGERVGAQVRVTAFEQSRASPVTPRRLQPQREITRLWSRICHVAIARPRAALPDRLSEDDACSQSDSACGTCAGRGYATRMQQRHA